MKHFSVTAVISSLLLLTACGPRDIDAEPTDTLQMPPETESAVSVTVLSETVSDLSEPVSDFSEPVTETLPPADYGELLDTLSIDWIKADISLYFLGTSEGNSYSGTLTLVSVSQNGTEHSCKIFDNEAFTLTPPEHSENGGYFSEKGFLYAESSELISFSRIDGGRKYLRLFELEKDKSLVPISVIPDDDYSNIIIDGYEFVSEDFMHSTNAFINYDKPRESEWFGANRYAYCCFDYGENNYYEWLVDLETDEAYITGSADFHRDEEVTEAVRELWDIYLFGNGYELDFGSAYGQYLETLSGDETDEISYYRVSPELAANREELMEYLRAPFTDECADFLRLTEEELFEGDYPVFTEDENGLVYISSYRGVPIKIHYNDYNTVRVTASEGDTVDAVACGSSVDGYYAVNFEFIRQDGKLTASSVRFSLREVGTAFLMQLSNDSILFSRKLVDPFKVRAGESFETEIGTAHTALVRSDGGSGIICRLERAEDFSGTDLSTFYTNESTEVFPYYHTEKFNLTPEESGKYIYWAGARYISEDGDVRDVFLGPQTVHVR